jgi:serine/threonine protein kinase
MKIAMSMSRYTTLSYRAPEMVDLYSGVPIDPKSDCWALGVLLYKLCYFTLPFGESALAIQSGQFTFPMQEEGRVPDELKAIINLLLTSNAKYRPNIYQTATLAFAAARRAKCPVYNIEKSLRIELAEAVEILHLREKLGANYPQMYEKAFEEFETQHRAQPSTSKGGSASKGEGGKGSGGASAEGIGAGIKPSPSQLLSKASTEPATASGNKARGPAHSAAPEGDAQHRKLRSPFSASADSAVAGAGSEVVEGVIVNTNAPYTSSSTLSSVTTSVNPRLRPKASASLHHTASASMALPPAPAVLGLSTPQQQAAPAVLGLSTPQQQPAPAINTTAVKTTQVGQEGKGTSVPKAVEQQQSRTFIATTPRHVAGTLPVAAAHSTLASCLRSSAFQ